MPSAVARAHQVIGRLAMIGVAPEDGEKERLDKAVITLSTSLITALSTMWVVTYFWLGLPVAAGIPLAYQAISIASLLVFARTKRLHPFRLSQLAMMLLLPFFLQFSLGGFIPSSAVVLWSFTAPIAALMFSGARHSVNWFVAYVAVLVLSGLLDPLLEPTTRIPTPLMTAFFVLNLAGVSVTAFFLLRFFVLERERERAKSERLLLNVLPASVAARLRDDEGTIADGFDEVTVLFADIVDFTTMSSAAAPGEIVDLLNRLFSWFDRLAEEHGLEKIKTIGDAYMVAGGLPIPRADHAEAVAEMALDMMAGLDAVDHELGRNVQLRIGIDTGPAVAGVIGVRRFIYDVWGDTVNTASRMESLGLPGSIQVTERTYRRLCGKYLLEERGVVNVKGKGEMKTWLLEGRLIG